MRLYLIGMILLAILSVIGGGVATFVRQIRKPGEVTEYLRWWLVFSLSMFLPFALLISFGSAYRYWVPRIDSLLP